MSEPVPGEERVQPTEREDDEDYIGARLDEGGEGDPDISDAQRTAKPRRQRRKKMPGVTAVVGFKADRGLKRKVDKEFEDLASKKMKLFRYDAYDAAYDIAMMPLTDSVAMNNLKLSACRFLIGGQAEEQAENPIQETMRQLQENYRKTAPRIKGVRETVREVLYENQQQIANSAPEIREPQ
jgi:hypothetical protein